MASRQLKKSTDNRRVSGVIAGIGEYFGWSRDVITFLRILYVILAFGSVGSFILIYFVAAWIMPNGESKRDFRSTWSNSANYEDQWRTGQQFGPKNERKMKEAEPVKEDKEDDWSDF